MPDTLPAGNATLSRAEAAALLGMSVASIRRREGRDLHPVVGADGAHRFDPAEVEGLALRSGRTAAPPAAALQTADADGAARLTVLEQRLEQVVGALNALAIRVLALPVPTASEFSCRCGASGLVAVELSCTACGARTRHGTWP